MWIKVEKPIAKPIATIGEVNNQAPKKKYSLDTGVRASGDFARTFFTCQMQTTSLKKLRWRLLLCEY